MDPIVYGTEPAEAAVAAARRLRARGVAGPLVAVCACAMSDYFEVLEGMR
jgi:hypothetical protein